MKLFPKTEKYSLGQKIDTSILEILEISMQAAYSHSKEEKINYLKIVDSKINLLKILIRLANEVRAIDDKKYLLLQEKLQEFGRMAGGWMRYVR